MYHCNMSVWLLALSSRMRTNVMDVTSQAESSSRCVRKSAQTHLNDIAGDVASGKQHKMALRSNHIVLELHASDPIDSLSSAAAYVCSSPKTCVSMTPTVQICLASSDINVVGHVTRLHTLSSTLMYVYSCYPVGTSAPPR